MRLAIATLALVSTAASGLSQTADAIVSRYLEARGGGERLQAVKTLRLRGRMSFSGVEAPFVLELKRPGRMRTEYTINGQTGVQVFDGQKGWSVAPLPGEGPRPMGPEEELEAKAQADVDLSPLVDARAKGLTVELLGKETLSGGDTWRLLVRGEDARDRTLYLDTRTHLVVRAEETRELDGEPVSFVTELGDYRAVEGLVYPHRIDVAPGGRPEERQRLEVDSIEINPPLPDARFTKPGSAP